MRPGKEEFAVAASPISIAPVSARPNARRRPLILTSRRLEANRRNAARSTGPRTPQGKARVARNAIKHGFFAAPQRWSEGQHRDFEEVLVGLREEFHPRDGIEEGCVVTIAASYVRMAALLYYENIAAARHHEECERELNERIAAGPADMAERLAAGREELRRAGLWRPTIPGPREAAAICRYQGRLDRAIRDATANLEGRRALRGGAASNVKSSKQTQFIQENGGISHREVLGNCDGARSDTGTRRPEALRRTLNGTLADSENEKTKPLTSMFTGNRHQRRRARAMARRQT
jgi:hypothetical protein